MKVMSYKDLQLHQIFSTHTVRYQFSTVERCVFIVFFKLSISQYITNYLICRIEYRCNVVDHRLKTVTNIIFLVYCIIDGHNQSGRPSIQTTLPPPLPTSPSPSPSPPPHTHRCTFHNYKSLIQHRPISCMFS